MSDFLIKYTFFFKNNPSIITSNVNLFVRIYFSTTWNHLTIKKKKKRFKNIPPTEPPARNVKNVSATRLQYPWKSSEISPIRRQTEPQRPSKQTIAPRSAMQTRRKIKYRREANHYRVNVSNLLTIISLPPTGGIEFFRVSHIARLFIPRTHVRVHHHCKMR